MLSGSCFSSITPRSVRGKETRLGADVAGIVQRHVEGTVTRRREEPEVNNLIALVEV